MTKIKILFYSHTIDFAGTWRSHERILLNLDRDKFDPYVFYTPNQDNNRLDFIKENLENEKIIPFEATVEKLGPETGYSYCQSNFIELAGSMKFDIIHFARSGYYEWPFIERISPIQIETNIFAGRDRSPYLDYSVSICNRISQLRNGSDRVVYNPIPLPLNDMHDLKSELNIPNEYHVFGRIGRKANFNPLPFLVLEKLKNLGYKFKYIIIGACINALSAIKQLGLEENCIVMDTTNDDLLIHKFYNTIDIFLHYRSDGECHSTSIGQSLIYGKPVISHFAGYNGQYETIDRGGKVCHNEDEYLSFLVSLLNDKTTYKQVSDFARKRGLDFEQNKIVRQWEEIYQSLYYEKLN
jgi:glycosyltransferase involved in cell wall biosynthesis